MSSEIFDQIAELSKLSFDGEEKQKFIDEMSAVVALMDTVKEFDATYDDTKDGNEIRFTDLRDDAANEPFDLEKLLSNTKSRDDYYVVPRLME